MSTQTQFSIQLIAMMLLCFALTGRIQAQCTSCGNPDNLVENGDFETGGLAPSTTALTTGQTCTNGTYAVVTTASELCTGFSGNTYDHTIGSQAGSYMMIDGHATQATNVWQQTVSIVAGETYNFSFWVMTWPSTAGIRPDFQVSIGNNTTILTSTGADLTGSGNWEQLCTEWTATGSGSMVLTIRQTNSGGTGWDYGLDDIFFGTCCQTLQLPALNFSGNVCANDLVLNLAQTFGNFTLKLEQSFGATQTHTTTGGALLNLYSLWDIVCGEACGFSPYYRLTFSGTDDCGNRYNYTSDLFKVLCPPAAPGIRVGKNSLCPGETTYIQVINPKPSYTYTWYSGGSVIGTGTIVNNVPANAYTLVATDPNGCESSSAILMSIRDCDIKPNKLLSLFPNPTTDEVILQAQEGMKIESYTILDSKTGKQLLKSTLEKPVQEEKIRLKGMAPGVYLMKVYTTEGKVSEHKLVIK